MRVEQTHSHLNGLEYLQVHHGSLWQEVCDVVANVDAAACRTKVSKEKRSSGKVLYSPRDLNEAFKDQFETRGWRPERRQFFAAPEDRLLRRTHSLEPEAQRIEIANAGYDPIPTYNQTDFVKDRVAVEVQFGKYAFVAHDLFVKHLSFDASDVIDVGIEILPMKELERDMSSGVPYYERDLLNVVRQGRGVPAVPLVLMGIAP